MLYKNIIVRVFFFNFFLGLLLLFLCENSLPTCALLKFIICLEYNEFISFFRYFQSTLACYQLTVICIGFSNKNKNRSSTGGARKIYWIKFDKSAYISDNRFFFYSSFSRILAQFLWRIENSSAVFVIQYRAQHCNEILEDNCFLQKPLEVLIQSRNYISYGVRGETKVSLN